MPLLPNAVGSLASEEGLRKKWNCNCLRKKWNQVSRASKVLLQVTGLLAIASAGDWIASLLALACKHSRMACKAHLRKPLHRASKRIAQAIASLPLPFDGFLTLEAFGSHAVASKLTASPRIG
jgi:hypothetical protein